MAFSDALSSVSVSWYTVFNTLTLWQDNSHFANNILKLLFCAKNALFWFKFHWNLFAMVQLTICQLWFRWWLGAEQATSHHLNQWWSSLLTSLVSPGFHRCVLPGCQWSLLPGSHCWDCYRILPCHVVNFLLLLWNLWLPDLQINGLVQERCNSIANALELCLPCTNPSKWVAVTWLKDRASRL